MAALQRHIGISYVEIANPQVLRTTPLPAGLTQTPAYDITLIHLNALDMAHHWSQIPPDALEGKYVIGQWSWELADFPETMRVMFQYINEVWVATSFMQESVSRVSPVPVVKICPPIQVQTTPAQRRDFNLPDNRFIFTFSFSPHSSIARKNPFGLIRAFQKAFGKSQSGPLLVIKQHYGDSLPLFKEHLRQEIETVNGCLINQDFSRQEMYNFLNLSDCYVSLHRSEGLGLGIVESMALGKPVIATAYSGNHDFMQPDNSYGVSYILREITPEDHHYQPNYETIYEPGQIWAEPDLDHAAELMTHVYENPEESRRVGEKAKNFMSTSYNMAVQGELIEKRLKTIVKNRSTLTRVS